MKNKEKIFSKKILCIFLALLLIFPSGCGQKNSKGTVEYLIGVSQANMREPWRLIVIEELKEAAAKHPEIKLIFTDATDNKEKQKKDLDKLISFGADLLIVSPCDEQYLTPVVSEIYKTLPVIVLDRVVEGYEYSLFIGPNNTLIGQQAGQAVAEMANGKEVNVLEISGNRYSQLSKDRNKGFNSEIVKHRNINTNFIEVTSESRDETESYLLANRGILNNIDIIFTHNDYMALGAYKALNTLKLDNIKIISIDGFSGENGGLELVKSGRISETITCPTGGKEAIESALEILNDVTGIPKQINLKSHRITRANVLKYEENLKKSPVEYKGTITVGYAQIGSESAWRLANTNSILESARDFGINLIIKDANQSKENQIEAIHSFIEQKVDIIVLSPVIDSGWESILQEAKDAGIPVILSDRNITVNDSSLYDTYIGADFVEEGRRAMRWISTNISPEKGVVRMLEIQGTIGASPTVERKLGFEAVISDCDKNYEIVYSQTGNFTKEGGQKVIQDYLRKNSNWDIDVIFAHNDDMALGAIEILKQNGIKPGEDVKIVSVDGMKDALNALQAGELNCIVECNPLLGPQLMKAITDRISGKELPLKIITDEKVFTKDTPKSEFKYRKY